LASDPLNLPPDLSFVSLPKPLAEFHHLPEHVPLILVAGAPPPPGYNFAEGVKAMERLLQTAPNVPGSYLYRLYLRKWPLWQKAAPLLEAARVVEAIPILVEALDIDPDCPLTCFQLGFCFRATGEFEKSVSFYQKALTLAPDAGWIYSNLGRTYAAWGRAEEAKEAYWQALNLLPGDAFIMQQLEALGDLVRLGGGSTGSETIRFVKRSDFEKKVVLEIRNRNDPTELLNLGFSLLGDRLWNLAEDCFERARELDAHSAKALLGLGVAHLQQNHPAEAERWLVEFLDQEPESSAGHLNLFKACLVLEKTEEAWEHLNTAVRLDPENRGALEQMVHFLLGADRREEAVIRLREIGENSPALTTPWLLLASLYGESNDREHELECLAEAHRRSPQNEEILLAYTAALGRADRAETVVKLLRPDREKLSFELTFNLALALRGLGKAGEGRTTLEAFVRRPSLPAADVQRAGEVLEKWDRGDATGEN
jgi:tetratricopeptide (TPR) repeat protein